MALHKKSVESETAARGAGDRTEMNGKHCRPLRGLGFIFEPIETLCYRPLPRAGSEYPPLTLSQLNLDFWFKVASNAPSTCITTLTP